MVRMLARRVGAVYAIPATTPASGAAMRPQWNRES